MTDERPPLWQRYRNLVRRHPAADVRDELAFHVDMRIEEAKKAGLSDSRARQAALERFGEYTEIESAVVRIDRARDRRQDRTEWLGDIGHDVTFALRSLRRARSFALAAIATLAIAIGANTAIFSVVNALLLQPLPYGAPERLVTITNAFSFTGELLRLREQLRSVSDIAEYRGTSADFDDGATAEHLDGAVVTSNMFSVLQSSARLGRTFTADESDPGRTHVIILGYGLWQRRFAGDSAVIGRRVMIDGSASTIVGVMPEAFAFPSASVEFWQPLVVDRGNIVSLWTIGGGRFIARLRASTSLEAARRELRPVALAMRHANPMWDPGPEYGSKADVTPLQEATVGHTRPLLFLLLGCVLLVLVVACVNVANLLLARASARESELAVRAALGGGRGRIVRQLLTESVVLAVLGGLAGVILAGMSLRWFVASLPTNVPRATEITLSASTLAFTFGLTVLTGIAFGLLPAWRATSSRGSAGAARGGRGGRGVGHQRISSALIVGQVGLAVLLAIGAELLVRSFGEMRRLDPGFRVDHIVTARVTPPPVTYADPARTNALYDAILARAGALPGVSSAAAVNHLPIARPVYGGAFRIEGQSEDIKRGLPWIDHSQVITPGYFSALHLPIIQGRGITDEDGAGTQPVVVVSQSTARHFWPGGDAIGKRIGYPWESPWLTIVGIAADVRADSLRDTTAMAVYIPFRQRSRTASAELTLVLRVAGDPAGLERGLRGIVAEVDRRVPVSEVRTMDDVIARSLTNARAVMTLVGAFALVALVLGAVGIYGVMSYVVSQRAQEMGIRMALGATTGAVRSMVVGRAARLALAGAVLGVGGSLLAMRPLRAMLFGVSPTDPATYLLVPSVFLCVALLASFAPARRATRVSPVRALRGE